jgi:MFS family permease
MFFQSQYLQTVLGDTAVTAGLLILPITAPMVVISPFSGRLIGRFGSRALVTTGMVLGTAGVVLLTRIGPDSSYADLLPGFGLFGIALGFVYAPMSTAAMGAMPREKVGIAAGVLAMNRVLAGAMALAIVGSIFQSLRTDAIAEGESRDSAFAHALADSTWFLVGLLIVGTILTWLLVRDTEAERETKLASGHEAHHRHHRFHL